MKRAVFKPQASARAVMRASSSGWRRRSLVAVRRREAGMDAPRKRLAQTDPFYLEVVPHLGERVTVGRRGDSLYKGNSPGWGSACPGLGSGAEEWPTVRLGRRRLPLSTRQRANRRPGEISMCTCTSTRTDISPLACTTNNASEVSAVRDIPILSGHRCGERRALNGSSLKATIDRGRGQYVQGEATP